MKKVEKSRKKRADKMAKILTQVSYVFGVRLQDMMSAERGLPIVCDARMAAYYFLCDHAEQKEVGKIMGARTAHAVRVAVNKVPGKRRRCAVFSKNMGEIEKLTNGKELVKC